MKDKSLSYRQKNRLLWVGGVFLLLLCWFLSFAKAVREVRDHRELNRKVARSDQGRVDKQNIRAKEEKLDTLMDRFYQDPAAFEDHFLQNVSVRLDGLRVQLIYDGGSQGEPAEGTVRSKDILLEGEYREIVKAIASLEKEFFVRSLRYEKERYRVELVAVAE